MNRLQKLLSLIAPFAFLSGSAQGHPLQAEPINHAYVFNFDQFNLESDPDEHVVEGGFLLLAELNCTACHTPPKAWADRLSAKPGPNLAGVGSRLDADTLWLMIRSPQHRKKGTQMPGLFAGAEGDAEKVEALTEYLSTMKEVVKKLPAGDIARGKELYHKVGCVACHEPATDYRPAKLAADAEPEKPGLGSVPIALADAYDVNALAAFLQDPLAHRPAGRMPDMRLSGQEAADIAAYLHTGREPEVATARAALKIAKQGIEKGREVFTQMNCVACHQGLETASPIHAPTKPAATKALALLKTDGGCLAETQPTGIPRYDLNELQKRALRLAIAAIQRQDAPKLTPDQRVDWQMTRLNCYACHDRDGKGGPEDPRAQYFTSNDGSAESLGELAHLPPNLDNVGRKLTAVWLKKVLWGQGGSVRPYMDTRMPNFGRAQTEMLVGLLPKADKSATPVTIDVSGLGKHHRAETGRQLIGAKGLACIACHGLKDRKSLGPPVIRLTHTVERLQPEYFKELLLNPQATQPGTMMPPMFMGRKKAQTEIESLWIYLKELDGQPLPEGLLSTEDFELKPEKAGRPIIFRSFIEGAGTHAIGVGFPQGLHTTFDAVQVRFTQVWRGRFLDAMSNWQSREMLPIAPLGTDLKALPAATGARVFSGYRLDKAGVPTFLYTVDGQAVEETLRPAADGKAFEHETKINGEITKEVLTW
ncbi:cytochrome c [Prosthecobacter fusiformis]|uniref:Cytochrome c n=1 Tax=Prosthecobacter fusiformis TaxID=48464 RepID=A0A4V3FDY6_9BACT|nr:c-type cytochrome [Prosthecobacter fusiformis]TDU62564.1 cytochrome c [Prosthecobacter fusiformis]